MLAQGIVEPSNSGWASPVVLIPKKDGSHRFCVDYRRLNAVTENDAYPLPTIQEILDSLSGATVFTNLDLNSGYWQVAMDPLSVPMTAFATPAGLYHFKVMPFGLKNAPASFQRLMEMVLGELRGQICFVYLDDIIVYSSSTRKHLQDLQQVFDKLRLAGLTLNLKKFRFCQTNIQFLGHIVTPQGIQPDPDKITAVMHFPTPTTLKEVQRFLGMAGWYHRFVPGFSQVAEPLNTLKKKGVRFLWTEACQKAFDTLKNFLTTPPILGHPNFQLHFVVYTDASDTGLGAVLTQQTGVGTDEVLAYASRTLISAERNYTTTERECLAIVWALDKWQYYLEARLFTVVTDHVALKWMLTSNKTNSRLIRWALRLQKFHFVLEYRKGRLNSVPDALSRISTPLEVPPTCNTFQASLGKSPCKKGKSDPVFPLDDEQIWKAQQADSTIMEIHQSLSEEGENSKFQDKFCVLEDKMYLRTVDLDLPNCTHYRLYVPLSLAYEVIQAYHDTPLASERHGVLAWNVESCQKVPPGVPYLSTVQTGCEPTSGEDPTDNGPSPECDAGCGSYGTTTQEPLKK